VGLHYAFLVSMAVLVLATVLSFLRGKEVRVDR